MSTSGEISEDRNGMTMPPHPTLSREGRGHSITLQHAAGDHLTQGLLQQLVELKTFLPYNYFIVLAERLI